MPRMLARISDQVNSMVGAEFVARRGDSDAEIGRGLAVDGGVSRSCRSYQLQVRQLLQNLLCKGGALAHDAYHSERPQPLDDCRGIGNVVVEHSDLRVAPDARPVGKPQRDVLVVVEDRNLHGCILPSAFGSKELGQSPRYRLGIVLHRNVAGRLDSDEPRLRNFAGIAFGKVDRLESVVLAPDEKLRRLRL